MASNSSDHVVCLQNSSSYPGFESIPSAAVSGHNSRTDAKSQTKSNQQELWSLMSYEQMMIWTKKHYLYSDIRLLQQLIQYVCYLATPNHVATIHNAMRRVVSTIVFLQTSFEGKRDDIITKFGFKSCFKALVYLEAHDVSFSVPAVLATLKTSNTPYEAVASLLGFHLYHYCSEVDLVFFYLAANPRFIGDDVKTTMVEELKAMARGEGRWQRVCVEKSNELYGECLQDSQLISLAKSVATKGITKWEHLDFRSPKGPYSVQDETAMLIMAYVSAVDRVMGVERKPAEWQSLRESLLAFGVCDANGDMFKDRSLRSPGKVYGRFSPDDDDILTPIGFMGSIFACGAESMPRDKESQFISVQYLDPSTICIERESGKEMLVFALDVKSAQLTQDVDLIRTRGRQVHILYNRSTFQEEQIELMDNVTQNIRRNWFADRVLLNAEKYPSPEGIEAIAFVLLRQFKHWRGIHVADGAAVVSAFQQLESVLKNSDKADTVQTKEECVWDGMVIDPEVIALTGAIVSRPDSFLLTAYLSHLVTYEKFGWDHLSSPDPIVIGAKDQIVLPSGEAVGDFIERERKICKGKIPKDRCGILGASQGLLLVRTRPPVDLFLLAIVLAVICVVPAFAKFKEDWREAISDAVQNLGTGMAPLIVLYAFARYRGWDVRDILKGWKSCSTVEVASKLRRRSEEEIVMCAKEKGIAQEAFQTEGNSVALHGREGNGATWCGTGVNAARLLDVGTIFLSKTARGMGQTREPYGLVDVGGFLRLTHTSDTWKAEEEDLGRGRWYLMSREELTEVYIS